MLFYAVPYFTFTNEYGGTCLCSSAMSGTVIYCHKNVLLRSRVLYNDYICKIVGQEQVFFNLDRFIFNFG